MLLRPLAPLMIAARPVAAFAEATPLSTTMDRAVALQASVLAEGTLNKAQVQVLKDVAPQKAVVLTVEGFAIDDARFGSAFQAASPTDAEFDALDDAGMVHLRSVMMLVSGAFLGGNVAIPSTDAKAWCASAAEGKGRNDVSNRIWSDQAPCPKTAAPGDAARARWPSVKEGSRRVARSALPPKLPLGLPPGFQTRSRLIRLGEPCRLRLLTYRHCILI